MTHKGASLLPGSHRPNSVCCRYIGLAEAPVADPASIIVGNIMRGVDRLYSAGARKCA